MRLTPPTNFDVRSYFTDVVFFQDWEIFPGHKTSGGKSVCKVMDALEFPADIAGKRVLEIGPWNGLFTFECVRRGAAEVVALGPDDPEHTGFAKMQQLLEVDNVRFVRDSVYNIPQLSLGTFDIVLFLGVIYHLRHPLLAIDMLYDVCRDDMYFDSPIIDFGRHIMREPIEVPAEFRDLPLTLFTQRNEKRRGGDITNWLVPNITALRDMIESSGFEITHFSNSEHWAFAKTKKSSRDFQAGFEGYAAAAQLPKRRTEST